MKGLGGIFQEKNLSVFLHAQNTIWYLETMEKTVFSFTNNTIPLDWVYKQELKQIHTNHQALEWLDDSSIRLIRQPAHSLVRGSLENS